MVVVVVRNAIHVLLWSAVIVTAIAIWKLYAAVAAGSYHLRMDKATRKYNKATHRYIERIGFRVR